MTYAQSWTGARPAEVPWNFTEEKDQGLVEEETETDTQTDTGADDDGPKNDPVLVDPNQLPLESGDEGDVKETEGA